MNRLASGNPGKVQEQAKGGEEGSFYVEARKAGGEEGEKRPIHVGFLLRVVIFSWFPGFLIKIRFFSLCVICLSLSP